MYFVELFHDITNRYIIYLCVNKKREKDRSFRWPGLTNDGKCSIEEHEVRTLPYTTGRNGMVWHRVLMAALIGREQSESNSNNPLLLIHVHKILRHFITVTGYMYITKYTLTSAQLRLISAKCIWQLMKLYESNVTQIYILLPLLLQKISTKWLRLHHK